MDRMYRLQRYIYDFTRKYYLLGRDRLLKEMQIQQGESVLEVGCGTARNLIILAKRHPNANLFGLDASTAMLETARSKVDAAGADNISLITALADDFSFDGTFGLEDPFDKIFFSYSISMIPRWRQSVDNALANLKPGGTLYFVDFHDQKALPTPFRRLLTWWLNTFHVRFWEELIPYFSELENQGRIDLALASHRRGYAFIATLRKNAA